MMRNHPNATRAYHHSTLDFGVVCTCGYLMLDSDVRRTPTELNNILKQNQVSVCVLRSKTWWDSIVQQGASGCNMRAECAKLGSFQEVVENMWGKPNLEPGAARKVGLTWKTIADRLATPNTPLCNLKPTSWDPEIWSTPEGFKRFWDEVVDAIFDGSTWPLECEVSAAGCVMSEDERPDFLSWYFSGDKDRKDKTYLENVIHHAFAVLVGGVGSPPHIDSITDMMSCDGLQDEEGELMLELSLAVGYLVQGIKYLWTLPPIGGQATKFLEFNRTITPVDETASQRKYRQSVLEEERVPFPFQGKYSMGWPSEKDWKEMGEQGINNHFHTLVAGDRYIIVDGAWHAVVNRPSCQPVSVAHDDRWLGGRAELLRLLRRSRASECPA